MPKHAEVLKWMSSKWMTCGAILGQACISALGGGGKAQGERTGDGIGVDIQEGMCLAHPLQTEALKKTTRTIQVRSVGPVEIC